MRFRSIPSLNSLLHLSLRLLLALAVLVGGLRPEVALGADDNVKRAREHHKAGDQAFKDGRYQDAYREWEAGFNLSGRPLFLLNMAHAERRRGELHNARALYRRFLLMEPQTKLRGEVESVLAEIDAAMAEAPAAKEAATEPPAADSGTASAPASTTPPPSLLGSPSEPPSPPPSFVSSSLPDEPAPTPPIYKRWWFWTGLGVAAAAGGASFFLLRGDRYTKMGSIGTVGGAR